MYLINSGFTEICFFFAHVWIAVGLWIKAEGHIFKTQHRRLAAFVVEGSGGTFQRSQVLRQLLDELVANLMLPSPFPYLVLYDVKASQLWLRR